MPGVTDAKLQVTNSSASKSRTTPRSVLRLLSSKSVLPVLTLFYVVMIAAFSLANPIFISVQNIGSVILNLGIPGIVAIGLTFVVLAGHVDLSVGSIFAFSAYIAGILIEENTGVPIPLGIAIGVLTGAAVGALNGFVVTVLGVNSIITTLGTMAIFRGLAQLLGSNTHLTRIENEALLFLGRGYLFDYIPVTFAYLVALLAICSLVLGFTKYGRHVYATGASEMVSRLYGVATKKIQFSTFVISGLFAAGGGVLLMSQLARASYTAGEDLTFKALTVVILGGISLSGGRGAMIGVLVAIFIVGSIANGLSVVHVPINARDAFTGLVLIGAIIFDSIRNRNLA